MSSSPSLRPLESQNSVQSPNGSVGLCNEENVEEVPTPSKKRKYNEGKAKSTDVDKGKIVAPKSKAKKRVSRKIVKRTLIPRKMMPGNEMEDEQSINDTPFSRDTNNIKSGIELDGRNFGRV